MGEIEKTKKSLCFVDYTELVLDWCGKFQAPEAGWKHMTRTLTNYELMVVTEGVLYIADENHHYEVKKGEYLLMAPTVRQYGWKESACSFYWLHFAEKWDEKSRLAAKRELEASEQDNRQQEKVADYRLELPVYHKLATPERVIILMKQLQDSARRYGDKKFNNTLAWAVLQEIACQCQKQSVSKDQTASQLFHDIADYIQYFVSQPLKVTEIAEHFGYSSRYLSELFHKYGGMSVKQYILQQKMEYAMAALSDTNRTITQIACEAGFEDANHFTSAFKKYAGMPPSQYRDSFGRRALYYK